LSRLPDACQPFQSILSPQLCYTRNTSIPCAMMIETDDAQVADVLASIKSSALYLQRCVRCTLGSASTNVSPCGQAVWWPAPDAAMAHFGNAAQRHIMGEIHLRRDLHPSTAINQFQVEASTVILDAANLLIILFVLIDFIISMRWLSSLPQQWRSGRTVQIP
jgi:hypothetical protein